MAWTTQRTPRAAGKLFGERPKYLGAGVDVRPCPMRLLFSTAALMGLLFLASCNKDSDCSSCVLMGYTQTQCADPWGYGVDRSDVAVEYAVRDFFASNGVVINDVSIYGETQPVTNCTACSCPTGKTIYALVDADDRAALTQVGFY
jgi:hypothetical protein